MATPNRATIKEAGHEKAYHIRRFGYTQNSIEAALADDGRNTEVRSYGTIGGDLGGRVLEIGIDQNRENFFGAIEPAYSPKKVVLTIKSTTAREVFKQMPEFKKLLRGGEFLGKGYYISMEMNRP